MVKVTFGDTMREHRARMDALEALAGQERLTCCGGDLDRYVHHLRGRPSKYH